MPEYLESAYFKTRSSHRSLKYFVTPYILRGIEDHAHKYAKFQARLRYNTLQAKLDRIRVTSPWYSFSMPENIINLSSRQLSIFEEKVLGLGMSFNLPPTERDIISTAAAFDKFLYKNRENLNNKGDLIRGMVSPLLLSIQKQTPLLPKSLYEALKVLGKSRDIKIMPADKGGKVVVLNQADYDDKIFNLLSDGDTYEKLDDCPLSEQNKYIRKRISDISKSCIDPSTLKKFLFPNCKLSYIYGIPKVHKTNCPLRPIISNVGTATRSLAGWLAGILSPYLGKISGSHLRNSLDFKDKLRIFASNHSTNTGKLVSLDVVSLFTSVPTEAVINFISRKIDAGVIQIPIEKPQFLSLIELCVNNNYFQFKDQYYRQKFGISMGSPLSPVLANLFMEYFETELLPTLSYQPPLWLRYVDDIILFWPDDRDFSEFFLEVNQLIPSIKFTTEWEEEGNIPFLDMRVFRMPSGFSTSIYRKPTHSNQYIHFFSWQPDHIKRSSIFSLMLRAYRLSDHPHLEPELSFLYKSFRKVGFPLHVISSVHSGVKRKFYSREPPEDREEDPKPTIGIPYNKFVRDYVRPVFSGNNFRVVSPASNSLRTHLVRNKPPQSDDSSSLECAGVYSVPCSTCNLAYYGETGRSVEVRLGEHKSAVRKGDLRNACFKHVSTSNHDINWSNSHLIFRSEDWYQRLVVESSCIVTKSNFNNMRSTLAIDKFSAEIILSSRQNISLQPP